jgi:hypothetical protein
LEYGFKSVGVRHAFSAVGHSQLRHVRGTGESACCYNYLSGCYPAFLHGLQAVAQKVDQHLLDLQSLSRNRLQTGGEISFYFKST